MKRTLLPLNGLRVFDAAARALSFTRAADELAVTPAAVGQQVRALEEALGVVLFRRTPKGLELTPEGEAGLAQLRHGFLAFEDAVRAMQSGQSSHALAIAAPRDLTALWLLPRLTALRDADPALRVMVSTASGDIDFTQANLDLAIVYADGPGEHEGAAVGPAGYAAIGDGAVIGWPGSPEPGGVLTVADAGLAMAAAAAGLGRAVVPALLADDAPVTVAGTRRYWLIAPLPQWRQKKVRALVAALGG